MATLYGSILRDDGRNILFSVASRLGDAAALGLCGEIYFAKRQIIMLSPEDGHDRIRVGVPLAMLKAQECQLCE